MSMMGHLRAVSPDALRTLIDAPDVLAEVVAASSPPAIPPQLEKMLPSLPSEVRERLLSSLESGRAQARSAEEALRLRGVEPDQLLEPVHLDKSWHGLHYLLSGAAGPVEGPGGIAVLGGAEVGDDLGYGPARWLSAEQVAEIAAHLGGLSEEALLSRYAADAMEGLQLYPGGWSDPGAREGLLAAFRVLRGAYQAAHARRAAMISWLS